MRKIILSAAAFAAIATFTSAPATADAVEDFYKGNTIRFTIGAAPGGGYDLYSRTLVQHMQNKIPGKPRVLIVNMPGSGGVKASNYVYSAAAKDGTTLLMPFWTHPIFQLIRPKGIKFDMSKMLWIGNMAELNSAVVTLTSVATSIEDAKKKVIIMAASGKGSETYIFPTLLNALIGTKFKLVLGYRGARNMSIAMERNEAQGRGGSWQSWNTIRPQWIKDKTITALAQAGLRRLKALPDVPLITELVKPEDRPVARLLSSPVTLARIVGFPPGASRDKVEAMRTAFTETMRDPAFLADAAKRKMDLAYVSGADVQRQINDLMKTPKAILRQATKVLGY